MLEYEVARRLALELGSQLGPSQAELVSVDSAQGRVLSEDVVAPLPLPSRDYSAMDGYAVATRDFASTGLPLALPIAAESRPGSERTELEPGTTHRIFTGGTIPNGADAVVIQENVVRSGDHAEFSELPRPGAHIRRAGEDLAAGTVALHRGTRISSAAQSLLAMVERRQVLVAPRPRVGVLCTGDELREPLGVESELEPWDAMHPPRGLAESNSYALLSLCERFGALGVRLPSVIDDTTLLERALTKAYESVDILVTVGGASVGDHDLLRPVLLSLGAELAVPKVNIKPGKPVFMMSWRGRAVLGLPGNPSSAFVTFLLFGLPLLGAWQGETEAGLPELPAPLARGYRQKPGRRAFLRGHFGATGVEILENQASGAGTTMARANVLVHLPPEVSELRPGAMVQVMPLFGL